MPAQRAQQNWNNQWWSEVVKRRKTELEPMVSTKAGTRYKTKSEVEVKQLRRGLLNIKSSLISLANELEQHNMSSEAEELLIRQICSIQHYIETLT